MNHSTNNNLVKYFKLNGFLMMEMIFVLMLIAMLAIASIPSVINWQAKYSVSQASHHLLNAFNRARFQSIQLGKVIIMQPNYSNNQDCQMNTNAINKINTPTAWQCGWLILTQSNNHIQPIEYFQALRDVNIISSRSRFQFVPPIGKTIGHGGSIIIQSKSNNDIQHCIIFSFAGKIRQKRGPCRG